MGIFLWIVHNAFRQAVFLLNFLLLASFAVRRHLAELGRQLKTLAFKGKFRMQGPSFTYRFLAFYYREYRAQLDFARHTDHHVGSGLMFADLFTNTSINLVMIGKALFRPLSTGEKLVLAVMVPMQVSCTVVACLGMITWSEAFLKSDRLLYTVQLKVLVSKPEKECFHTKAMTTAKLKLSSFYETVCSTDEFRFHMGNLGKISKKNVFEFALLYSGFVLYVAKMVQKDRL